MTESNTNRKTVTRTIGGIEALVNTEVGEIFLDMPATSPRYIRVREGEHIQEGDVRTKSDREMASAGLSRWRVDSILPRKVIGTALKTDETEEWDREWIEQRLGTGEFSVDLTGFERVNVSVMDKLDQFVDRDESISRVVVTAYGNNGERFTQVYRGNISDDWSSLMLVREDKAIDRFDDRLRAEFDTAIQKAFEVESQYR
ncbi:hypothetical protein [Haladaptatus caseinilyticus]|uniref:hypothetical protein n=1 Tax=Haladaptatus caseinilyticus TaxID=2993314 RepID=UPI00224A98AA|nr:hypothetical protein [Haladaptatus caseinilyticus]